MSSQHDEDGEVKLRERKKTKKPRRFKVLMHNDDYTTMEFVVYVLMKHFNKDRASALHIMLHIHHKGVGVCGTYPRSIAEAKAEKVVEEARAHGMPLMCSTEPE